jgi:hypothetical protein
VSSNTSIAKKKKKVLKKTTREGIKERKGKTKVKKIGISLRRKERRQIHHNRKERWGTLLILQSLQNKRIL